VRLISTIRKMFETYRLLRRWEKLRGRGMHIGKDVNLPFSTFIDTSHCHLISIGDRCGFGPYCAIIAHDAMPNEFLDATLVGRVTIHESCHFGMRTLILPGVTIGPCSIVGAGSVVSRDIPPYSVAAGNPARVICTLEAYLAKHRKAMEQASLFPFESYTKGALTPDKSRFMQDKLAKGPGYITGGYTILQQGKSQVRTR
jgi:maltose O-acetyltransferase